MLNKSIAHRPRPGKDQIMENIIRNIKDGQGIKEKGFELARKIADGHTERTGYRCEVRRILDYADIFDGHRREHYSFDVIEVE